MKPLEPEFIPIGKILASSGSKGKIKIAPATDFLERFAPSATVYVDHHPMVIDSTEWHKGRAVIKLDAINSVEDAEGLRGRLIEIHHAQLYSLPEGQYYHFQLIGLEVWTTEGELLGNITEILSAPGNDTYIVSRGKEETLIPAIEDVIKSIDLDKKRVLIEPIEGLLELNKKAAS